MAPCLPSKIHLDPHYVAGVQACPNGPLHQVEMCFFNVQSEGLMKPGAFRLHTELQRHVSATCEMFVPHDLPLPQLNLLTDLTF